MSKDEILNKIKQSIKNRSIDLNENEYQYENNNDNLLVTFKESLLSVSADFEVLTKSSEINNIIHSYFPENDRTINTIKSLSIKSIDISTINNPKQLHPLNTAIIKGEFSVAENGTIWIDGGKLEFRAIPFLCENLVVVVNKKNIVLDMHEAYEKIDKSNHDYGVFITGPSKTADIEQTLVVGAQGPKRLLVILV